MAKLKIKVDPVTKNKRRIVELANNNPVFAAFVDMGPEELETWIESALDSGIELRDLFVVLAQIVQQMHHQIRK